MHVHERPELAAAIVRSETMALLHAAARRSSLAARHARRGMASVPAWDKLGFDFTETRSMVKYNWKDGA